MNIRQPLNIPLTPRTLHKYAPEPPQRSSLGKTTIHLVVLTRDADWPSAKVHYVDEAGMHSALQENIKSPHTIPADHTSCLDPGAYRAEVPPLFLRACHGIALCPVPLHRAHTGWELDSEAEMDGGAVLLNGVDDVLGQISSGQREEDVRTLLWYIFEWSTRSRLTCFSSKDITRRPCG